ncbi:MAG TPA: hypothetical protein VJ841_02190, partial [Candidatus Saccharimonadales bacterium]|nr:hypothetical protein [Candidatus Saccharimonadales bacterium]
MDHDFGRPVELEERGVPHQRQLTDASGVDPDAPRAPGDDDLAVVLQPLVEGGASVPVLVGRAEQDMQRVFGLADDLLGLHALLLALGAELLAPHQ